MIEVKEVPGEPQVQITLSRGEAEKLCILLGIVEAEEEGFLDLFLRLSDLFPKRTLSFSDVFKVTDLFDNVVKDPIITVKE